jgi:predicted DNA-binding ribbon-helix-helix protein
MKLWLANSLLSSNAHMSLRIDASTSSSDLIPVDGELRLRGVKIKRRRTTVRMDDETWDALNEIVRRELVTINELCELLSDEKLPSQSLTAVIRIFVLRYFRKAATEKGHLKAGHKGQRRAQQIARLVHQHNGAF